MKYLIYISTAVNLMDEDELIVLLNVSRVRNQKHEVTGVLLYSGGTFIQVLEGRPEDVDHIFGLIKTDFRHRNVVKLIEEPIAVRTFPQWNMGFPTVSPAEVATIRGYINSSEILSGGKNNATLSILKTFITTNNLVNN